MSKKMTVTNLAIIATLFLAVFLLWRLSTGEGARLQDNTVFSSVELEGEYSVDGGLWQLLTPDTQFNTENLHTVSVRGHLTKDIPQNLLLMLRITDLRVRIAINGQEVYSFGQEGDHHSMIRSGGNVWHVFSSFGISQNDLVEMELSNVYRNVHPLSFRLFLDEMYYGSVQNLYRNMLRESGATLLLGLLILMLGVVELVVAVELTLFRQRNNQRTYYGAGLAIFGGMWFCIQFNVISLLVPYPAFFGGLDIICLYLTGMFLNLHITTYLTGRRRRVGTLATSVNILWAFVSFLMQFSGVLNLYDTPPVGTVILILCLIFAMGAFILESVNKPNRAKLLVLLSLFPIAIGGILDAGLYWSRLVNDTIWVQVGFAIFVLAQSLILVYEFKETNEQAQRVKQMEYDLLQKNVAIMLSQIQPHFLFNALNTIQNLCRKDSVQAIQVIQQFSDYLRGNLDSLKRKEPVLFETELFHTQCYLDIEKCRFGDRMNVEYDFQVTNFLLPVLTVQPIVENAIRYGVTKKRGGGTVRISTRQEGDVVTVTVVDDGVGFDPLSAFGGERSHIGIDNVRNRLETMCGGSLVVESIIGSGTTATLVIPQKQATIF